MKPITRKEYYLAKAAGTYTGPTPPPVLSEDYYLATLAGDYSGYCPAPVTRLDMFMSAAAELTSYVPQPITRLEMYWYAIAKGAGYVPEPVTREEQLLYAIIHKEPKYIDKTAEGSTILLTDSAEAPFTAFTIYGHSTQSGTPSPDNPVPIVSAGDDGEINVSVSDGGTQSQTLTLSTPGGLPGIPVSSGGNYTDESGQQWVRDEVDLARGKYVQRVSTYLIRSVFDITNSRQKNPDYFGCSRLLGLDGIGYNKNLMSDKLVFVGISKSINGSEITIVPNNGYIVFGLKKSVVSEETVGAVTNYLSENPITILFALKEPIETDLPAKEIAAYKTLHTYSPTTTVSNDAAAWMKVGYKATP